MTRFVKNASSDLLLDTLSKDQENKKNKLSPFYFYTVCMPDCKHNSTIMYTLHNLIPMVVKMRKLIDKSQKQAQSHTISVLLLRQANMTAICS